MIHPYGTHAMLLVQALRMTDGPVVEFGMGRCSTPLLHGLMPEGRELWCYETATDWFNEMYHVKGYTKLVKLDSYLDAVPRPVDVVFIDCDPPEMRGQLFRLWRPHAKLLVLHDFEEPATYGYPTDEQPFMLDTHQKPWTAMFKGERYVENPPR